MVKDWWIEIVLAIGLFFILHYWALLREILQKYNIAVPVLFYLGCEIAWDVSFVLTLIYTGIFRPIWKRYRKRFIAEIGYVRAWIYFSPPFWLKIIRVVLVQTLNLPKEGREILSETKPKTKLAWFWFSVNRGVAIIQPSVTMIFVAFLSNIPPAVATPIYGFLFTDLIHTLMVIWRVRTRTRKVNIRNATLSDLNQLLELDHKVWPKETQATKENLRQRIVTSPPANFVAIDRNGHIVGVLYCRLLEDYNIHKPLSWYKVVNNGDFTPPNVPRFLYGVGLTVSGGAPKGTSDMLMLKAAQYAILHRLQSVLFGSRLPDYHRYADKMTLDEYVRAKKRNYPLDPELHLYIKKATISFFKWRKSLLGIATAVKDYFPDPPSLNCAAIVEFRNPFYRFAFPQFWSSIFGVLISYF